MATTNALLGIGRLNNFRLNALDPVLVKQRQTKVGIILNGADVRGRVRHKSLTIRDSINDAPNSASFTVEGPPRSAYVDQVLYDQPIAYWRLGDVGTTALDQTGHGHPGAVLGGLTLNQPGAVSDGDRAMRFPGTVGARVEVAASAAFALTQGVAVEAWVKTEKADQQGGVLEKTIGGAVNSSYALMQLNTLWLFRVRTAAGALLEVIIPVEATDVGQWIYLVGEWTAAGAYLFKNGALQGYQGIATATLLQAGTGVLEIGHLGSSIYPFAGTIDEVAVYPYVSGDRIAAHYAYGRYVAAPTIAQEVRVTIGVDDPVLLFNGALTQVDLTYEGRAHTAIYHCAATDDTARANRRRPFGQWTNVSATVIAQALIANFVPGFGSAFVQAGLPPVTVIFDGSEGMNRCLTQITNLIGGYWYFQDQQLHLFRTEATDAPDPIDAAHRFLDAPHITASVEMSQVRTRVYGRGHGEALLSEVTIAETLIPLADAVLFSATGGKAIALAQVLTYTGRVLGGQGSLIGPGAGPSVAPTATLGAGTGLGTGTYSYAYTDVTASGESLPGPLATLSVGPTAPPATAPTVSAPSVGTGPNPGNHAYGVSFVTASGETTLGPTASGTTGLTAPPVGTLTVGEATVGGAVDAGPHEYVMTFVTSIGETTPGPVSRVVITGELIAPPSALAFYITNYNGHLSLGTYQWAMTWIFADGGETLPSPTIAKTFTLPNATQYLSLIATVPPGAVWINIYRTLANGSQLKYVGQTSPLSNVFIDDLADTSLGVNAPVTNTASRNTVPLTDLLTGDPMAVTSRNVYRRFNGAGSFLLVATIPNNTATTYTDMLSNASRGVAAPVTSTAHLQRFILTSLPIGDARVTGRKIYRTAAGAATYQLAATIADNTTSFWTDTILDASLGATAPVANTATANRVALGAIAVGAAAVTARKIYRTVVNGSQLKLLATLADNITLIYLDAVADGALGANAPSGDTSGLTQPQGQVNAGSSALPTASAGPFPSTGGWVVIGSQVVRYTGISGNSLTGIPAAGPGALSATVRYGDHILAAPMLTGVSVPGGLAQPVGTVIYLWVQRDDAAAQNAMVQYDGGDGIYEYLVQDERRGEPSLTALCDAHLLTYKSPVQTVTYATRDLKTKSGKPIVFDLTAPSIYGTLVIQDVTIDQIDVAPGLAPRFVVTASTLRFSFEDLLRQLAGSLEGLA